MTYSQPFFSSLLILTVAGALWYAGRKSRVLVVAACALFLFSWPPLAIVVLHILEDRYPARPPAADRVRDAGAIVVLASSVLPPNPPRPIPVVAQDTAERCWYAAWLHKAWPQLPIIVSGGTGQANTLGRPYSRAMFEQLVREGVSQDDISTEEHSHSTYENAAYTSRILRSRGIRRIILVTDAYHMGRAERCFRKQGIEVVPAACGFRAAAQPTNLTSLFPSWEAISLNEDTAHEVLGLLWYSMSGRI